MPKSPDPRINSSKSREKKIISVNGDVDSTNAKPSREDQSMRPNPSFQKFDENWQRLAEEDTGPPIIDENFADAEMNPVGGRTKQDRELDDDT